MHKGAWSAKYLVPSTGFNGLDLPPMYGDHIHLQQVVLNVLPNSLDALEQSTDENRRIFIQPSRWRRGPVYIIGRAIRRITGMSDLPKTVFIVDDDPSFLAAMSRWLCAFGYSIESYSSVMDFLTQRPKQAAGCVITDLSMPGMGGIDLQSALAQSGNPLPIVFLTGHGDIPASVEAMRNGAEDFLLKTAEKEAILDAVERALARDIFERSVKRHRANLMKKLQVSSVAELARIAVEAGLVSETGEPGNVGDDAFPAT